MNAPDYIPSGYSRIQVVDSLSGLFNARLGPAVNVVLWPRSLKGDFNALARWIDENAANRRLRYSRRSFGFEFNQEQLKSLRERIPRALEQAADAVARDMDQILDRQRKGGISSVALRLIKSQGYAEKERIHEFHADRAFTGAGRILCCYNRPVTEGIRNEDAAPLDDNSSHFRMREGARAFSFREGDLWRMAVQGGNPDAPPFIHRAPRAAPGDPPRLILMAL